MPASDQKAVALKDAFREHDIPWPTKEQLEQARRADAEEKGAGEQARAYSGDGELALWALADLYIPPDVREWAERHKMPEFASEVWRSAFCAGWRAALRARPETMPV